MEENFNFDENIWFINLMKIHQCKNHTLLSWKVSTTTVIYCFDESIHQDQNSMLQLLKYCNQLMYCNQCDQISLLWLMFITLTQMDNFSENKGSWLKTLHPFYGIILWWILIIHHFDEHLSLWWESITLIKIHQFDKKSLLQ